MVTGRLTTLAGNAISAVQECHNNTSGEIYLPHQMKPDVTSRDATTGVAMIGIVMTGNMRNKGGTVRSTRTRTPLTPCSLASAMTSEAGAKDWRR